jgi:hypothetical protein
VRFSPRLAVAVLALLPLATAGCAYSAPAEQSQVQQIGQMLLNAYEASTTVPGVLVTVTQTAQSGIDPVADANGSYALWFSRKIGRASLTIQDAEGSSSLVAVRAGSSFYSAATQGKLAGSRVDLNVIGQRDPDVLPQIESPWIDPFQLTTLLGAVQWPDAIRTLGPVVVADSTGRHVEYQMTVDIAELARHESGADRDWLQAMGREPGGGLVTLDVTLQNGQISLVSASAPIPATPLPAVARGKQARPSAGALQTPPPASVVITAEFRYGKPVPVVNQP